MSRRLCQNESEVDRQIEDDFYRLLTTVKEKLKIRYDKPAEEVHAAVADIKVVLTDIFQSKRFTDVDYNDIVFCMAYLQRYALCHTALVIWATRQAYPKINETLRSSLLQDNSFKVVSVGGGPGTDILAFCTVIKEIFRNCEDLQLDLTLLDAKEGWRPVFNEVVSVVQESEFASSEISALFKDFHTTCHFEEADAITLKDLTQIKDADVILLVKLLSVIEERKRPGILKNIFMLMKPGAIFLYIDTFLDVVVNTARGSGMKALLCEQGQFLISSDDGISEAKSVSYYSIIPCTFDLCVYQKM